MKRRQVLQAMAATGIGAAASRRVLGANDRVRVGFVGIGLIGKRHLLDFMAQPDVDVVAIAECSNARLDEGVATAGGKPDRYKDFRRILDRKDVDALVVSTPDHWHPLMTMMACAAGKDVYVEKPLTHVVREGEWMVRVSRKYDRVVQAGTQQRSGVHYQKTLEMLRGGRIGEVRNVRIAASRNILPGFQNPVSSEPITGADWDMWLGPAPYVPFDPKRGIYHFRWYWDYSGGQTTNLLSHNLDIVEWVFEKAPTRIATFGGRYSLTGLGETPDLIEAILEYPGFVVNWSSHEASAGLRGGGFEFHGTKGRLGIDRAGLEIVPDADIPSDDQIPRFTAPPRATGQSAFRAEPLKMDGYEQVRDQFVPHVRNFLDCVKSRKRPVSDIESCVTSATSCLLVNVALKVGRMVRWDAAKNDVVGDPEASRLLTKEYRAPWDKELKALLGTS